MTAAAKIKAWIDDAADHAMIFCHEWTPGARGIHAKCEACGREISAWPLLAATAERNTRFHLVCRRDCLPIALRFGPVPYNGSIKENVLPPALEKFS